MLAAELHRWAKGMALVSLMCVTLVGMGLFPGCDGETPDPTPPAELKANAGADKTIAAGESYTLQGSASGGTVPYTYSWSPDDDLNDSTVAQPKASPSKTTTYTLKVTDSASKTATDTVTVTVTQETAPALVAEAGPNRTIASGGTCQLAGSASGGAGGYTYAWTETIGLDDAASATPFASPSQTTEYTLTVKDKDGATATDKVTVTVNPTSLVAQAGSDKTIASGSSCILDASVSGGTAPYTYAWSPVTGLDNPTIAQPTASPTKTTEYTLTVTDSNGKTATDNVKIVVPLAIEAGPNKLIAIGGACRLAGSASGGAKPYTYSWSPETGLDDPKIAEPAASPTETTKYTLTVTDGAGATATDTVTVNATVDGTYFSDGFETGTDNWTVSDDDWVRVAGGVQGSGWSVNYKEYPADAVAGISLKQCVDLSGSESPVLSVWYKSYGSDIEYDGFWGIWVGDVLHCYASWDGGVTWQDFGPRPVGTYGGLPKTSTWSNVVFDLQGFKTGVANIKLEFHADGDDIRDGIVAVDAIVIKEKE